MIISNQVGGNHVTNYTKTWRREKILLPFYPKFGKVPWKKVKLSFMTKKSNFVSFIALKKQIFEQNVTNSFVWPVLLFYPISCQG